MQLSKIEIINDKLIIHWSNNENSEIEIRELRKNCPCVYCNQFREAHQNSRLQVYMEDQLKISDIKIMGNYALRIQWKDGHNTGIFEYNKLK